LTATRSEAANQNLRSFSDGIGQAAIQQPMKFIQAVSYGTARMERPHGKRSAKRQSRGPKAEIREAEDAWDPGSTVPDEGRHGRAHEAGRKKVTMIGER
jgi:hypothetical protein